MVLLGLGNFADSIAKNERFDEIFAVPRPGNRLSIFRKFPGIQNGDLFFSLDR